MRGDRNYENDGDENNSLVAHEVSLVAVQKVRKLRKYPKYPRSWRPAVAAQFSPGLAFVRGIQ